MSYEVKTGNCLSVLPTLEAGIAQTCVTSPPYFGLRDYGTAQWEGGDEACDHKPDTQRQYAQASTLVGGTAHQENCGSRRGYERACPKCGARRVDSQIGLEETPEQYVAKLVEVFREVRRVLRDDGTLWLNLGDTYASTGRSDQRRSPKGTAGQDVKAPGRAVVWGKERHDNFTWTLPGGQKPKDLIGIPWMVAFALRSDGWYLRSDIIWHKPNPMPESVTDRPTKAHEYLFLLSKGPSYFYDAEAIKEPASDWGTRDRSNMRGGTQDPKLKHHGLTGVRPQKRRALELAAEKGLTDEHIEAIRACGITDAGKAQVTQSGNGHNRANVERLAAEAKEALGGYYREFLIGETRNKRSVWTVPTKPFSEAHFAVFPPELIEPCILAGSREGDLVIDPFSGAGTTGVVALKHGRRYLGCELNPEYVEMSERRLAVAQAMALRAKGVPADVPKFNRREIDTPLFGGAL